MVEAATYSTTGSGGVAGFPGARTHLPVAYPTASQPQAWAAGSPILLLQLVLGLEPDRCDGALRSDVRTHPHGPTGSKLRHVHGTAASGRPGRGMGRSASHEA